MFWEMFIYVLVRNFKTFAIKYCIILKIFRQHSVNHKFPVEDVIWGCIYYTAFIFKVPFLNKDRGPQWPSG